MKLASIPCARIIERFNKLARAGLMGTAVLLSGELATTNEAQAQSIHSIHSHVSALSGIPRIPVFQQPSAFPYYGNAFPNTYPGNYFGNYWGSYLNYGLNSVNPFFYNQFNSRPNNSLYYNRNNSQGSAYRNNSQSRSSSSTQRGGACCGVKPGTEVTHKDGIVECKLDYPVPLTAAQKTAQETLYKDVVKSLVLNGYPEFREGREVINKPEHILYYLTAIVIAHDLLNDDTLNDIQEGLKQGNRKLIETYGSAKFFEDAIGAIKFHKVKSGELDVAPEVLKRDIATVIKKLENTEDGIQEEDPSFSEIDDPEAKAQLIARAYHYLSIEQLKMIQDALNKVSSSDVAVRGNITLEQILYSQEFTYSVNGELYAIGPELFSSCVHRLNHNHSNKPDLQKSIN